MDVHDIESEPSSSEDEAVADASSAPNTPLSKKARARRRAAERKALRKAGVPAVPPLQAKGPQADFSDPSLSLAQEAVQQDGLASQDAAEEAKAQEESQLVPDEVVQEETVTTAVEGDDQPPVLTSAKIVTAGQDTDKPAAVSLTVEAAPTPAGTNTPVVGESSVPSSDTEDEGLEQPSQKQKETEKVEEKKQAPQSKDHQPGSKWRSIITRTIWTIIMVAGFVSMSHSLIFMRWR